jgi:hypothetical protein
LFSKAFFAWSVNSSLLASVAVVLVVVCASAFVTVIEPFAFTFPLAVSVTTAPLATVK